eukprot:3336741-Lingulodinium_polyedra.AAC.1
MAGGPADVAKCWELVKKGLGIEPPPHGCPIVPVLHAPEVVAGFAESMGRGCVRYRWRKSASYAV